MSSQSPSSPILRDASGALVIVSHDQVVAVAHDPAGFSNNVSRHLQIPNGLDGPAHTAARRLLDPFLAGERVNALEPKLAAIAEELVAEFHDGHSFDAVAELGARYSVRAQSAWLGWPAELEQTLLEWVRDHRQAARESTQGAHADVARRFDEIVSQLLQERRERPRHDVTTELVELRDEDGMALSDEQIISVLRNWTGGDLNSVALCVGVVVAWLARHREHQAQLAALAGKDPPEAAQLLDHAIDEILRADDPFVSNRRRATNDTSVAGCPVASGEVVVLDWRRANRDPAVFGDPDSFDPQTHAAANLVYGTGAHACPGRTLATRELRVLTQALLGAGRLVMDGPAALRREHDPDIIRSVRVRIEG
ncbi:Cytochrome P450 [Propionibacterium cyclohexanicum]|uniref:Cytochrome P450 n=1 Tax=Propionibacterium cyclohexanicum TaxID=64702 RepID=A0A1H9S5P3_9ACTN|nr:cytochrome P450 [Propionibacterium cyclohexanicum]SER80352.1 Cytochrome P450 [Propionibacterium cyclohexanicum]